jgi:hypothetical protein
LRQNTGRARRCEFQHSIIPGIGHINRARSIHGNALWINQAVQDRRNIPLRSNLADLAVPGIGDVKVVVGIDGDALRRIQGGERSRSAIAVRAGSASASDRIDHAGGTNLPDAMIGSIGDIFIPLAIHRDA